MSRLKATIAPAFGSGGRLDIGTETTGSGLEIAIRGEGPRVMLDAGLREILSNGAKEGVEIEPRVAGAWLACAWGELRTTAGTPEESGSKRNQGGGLFLRLFSSCPWLSTE